MKNGVELSWAGKGDGYALVRDEGTGAPVRVPYEEVRPRRLVEAARYGDAAADNLLISGENLYALKTLARAGHAGTVKCVYIDPPYNTGNAFAHYDDALEHSLWLGMMQDRLALLRELLAPSGVIFVSIDDAKIHYLRLLLDDVFGCANFCGQLVWEKKKKPSFVSSNLGVVTEYILAYARERNLSPPFVGGTTTVGKKYPLNNAGNSVKTLSFPAGAVAFRCADGVVEPQDMSEGNIITRLLDRVEILGGRNRDAFRLEGEWRYSQETLDGLIRAGEPIVISKLPFRPNHVKGGGAPKKLKNLLSIAHYQMSTYEDATNESRALFGERAAFDYPKPEKLLMTLIDAVTEEGDVVLDCFAGSGTTGAVALKMIRRFVLVEAGNHCETHIVPRLRKVIEGTDPGGVSPLVPPHPSRADAETKLRAGATRPLGWTGGGGFRYCTLGEVL
ncbi:MAG TPA: site-specific DNA-methyltransferase [Pyrinomonadaceae bacterium]|nr:site-specific DNA-methyltransferase [Pyrinomonadaceae bacterium]